MPVSAFQDQTFLIAGASKGIGYALAEHLSRAGASLLLHASNDASVSALKERLSGYNHTYFAADFTDTQSLEPLVKQALGDGCKLDGFVNCVGLRSRKPLHLLKPSHVAAILQANVASFIEMVRLVTHKSVAAPSMSIVQLSSISALVGSPGITAYAASKAATDSAVRCMAKELTKKNIRVNSIVCGQINTEAYQELMSSKPGAEDKVLERQYMGLGEPADVVNLISFLLSSESKFINGACLPADGGFLT